MAEARCLVPARCEGERCHAMDLCRVREAYRATGRRSAEEAPRGQVMHLETAEPHDAELLPRDADRRPGHRHGDPEPLRWLGS